MFQDVFGTPVTAALWNFLKAIIFPNFIDHMGDDECNDSGESFS